MVFAGRIRFPNQRHPWQELDEFWKAMEQASNRLSRPTAAPPDVVAFIPGVDLYDAGSSIIVKVDLPGVAPENLVISTEKDTIIIGGRRDPDCPETATSLSRERPVGRFARRIALPKNAGAQQMTATLRNGVLEITLPRTPKATIERAPS